MSDKEGIPKGWLGLDIGPVSAAHFGNVIQRSKTLVWNGYPLFCVLKSYSCSPMGVFEMKKFAGGTRKGMNDVIRATKLGCVTIIGGGDTASAAEQFQAASAVSHVSTGGGASLELLEGKKLPGVTALSDKQVRKAKL